MSRRLNAALRLLLVPAVLLAATSRLGRASAVSFDVQPGETMCVSEEVMKDELAVGEYSVPTDAATGLSQVSVHVTGPTPLKWRREQDVL